MPPRHRNQPFQGGVGHDTDKPVARDGRRRDLAHRGEHHPDAVRRVPVEAAVDDVILKVRQSGFDPSIVPFEITDRGITVQTPLENAEGIMRGMTHRVEPDKTA